MDLPEDYFTSDGGGKRGMIPYLPDLHLRTAIRRSERALFADNYELYLAHGTSSLNLPKQILTSFSIFERTIHAEHLHLIGSELFINPDSEDLYGKILSGDLIPATTKDIQSSKEDFEKSKLLATQIILPACDLATGDLLDNTDQAVIEENMKTFKAPELFHEYTAYKTFWEYCRNQIAQSRKHSTTLQKTGHTHNGIPYLLTTTFLFLYVDDRWNMFDYEQIMMIVDTLSSRALIVRAASFYHHMGLKYQPPVSLIQQVFSWGDKILDRDHNEGYSIIKKYEALITAHLLDKFEDHKLCKQYYNNLMAEARTDDSEDDLKELIDIITLHDLDPNQTFELTGYFRMFGHPTINEIEGISKQKDLVREELEIDQECVREASGGLIRLIVTEFISKNGRWPKCKVRDGERVSNAFRELVMMKSSIIDERLKSVSLHDWSSLEFEQNSPLNDVVDPTELVSDKSCSLPRSKFHLSYNSSITRTCGAKQEPHTRRLLTELLRDENFDPIILRETIQKRRIPKGWLVVGLCSKERELKVGGRLFTILAAPIRYTFGVTQKNIADSIMPYVSGQTMTLNDAQLVNKMYKQTSKSSRFKECKAVISIDFEKFNQRWRRESIHRVTTMCDEWFGTDNYFSFVHDFFDHAHFYLCSSFEPPEHLKKKVLKKDETDYLDNLPTDTRKIGEEKINIFKETPTTWTGQGGAGEGLWQKGWTIAIIGALHAVEVTTGIHSSIMGQGDNQVIVVSWEIPYEDMTQEEYLRLYPNSFETIINSYLIELTRIVNGMGMKVKLEETWISTKFMSYGKEPWFNGVYMTSVMKKIGRIFQEINDIHPTFANRIGSVFSTGYSGATKDYGQVLPYLLSFMEAASMLRMEIINSPINGSRVSQTLKQLRVLVSESSILIALILPKEFGGFPIIPFSEFIFRGHPDPVTSGLVWIKTCAKYIPEASRIMTWITSRDGINTSIREKDIERLIQDPVCLNFKSSGQYAGKIATLLENNLRTHVKNKQLKILFDASTTRYKEDLLSYLDSIEPCFPRVLNEVLRISPIGAQQSFLAQFRDIKTLKNLMGVEEGTYVVNEIQDSDIKNVTGVLKLSDFINQNKCKLLIQSSKTAKTLVEQDWFCTTVLADNLREQSWGRKILGSTTPYPYEQFRPHVTHSDPSCPVSSDEHILAIVIPVEEHSSLDYEKYGGLHQLARGELPAYTGSITSEKKTTGLISFQKSDNGARAAQRALHMKNWVFHQDGTAPLLMEEIAGARCNIPVTTMEGLVGEHYGGSITHRFRCVMLKHVQAPNLRPNISTHIQLSSDRMGKFSRGFDNYTMLFQSAYLTIYANIANLELLTNKSSENKMVAYHYHINCLSCCQEIEDIPLHTMKKVPKMPNFIQCPLVYSKCEDLVQRSSWILDKRLPLKSPKSTSLSSNKYSVYATASIIIGLNDQTNALTLLTETSRPEKVRYDHKISISVVMRLGIINIINAVSEFWYLTHFESILSTASRRGISHDELTGFMLSRTTGGLWDSLKPIILIPEIAEELLKGSNSKPNNVKAFYSGEGMDSFLSLLAKRAISNWQNRGYPTPPVLAPAKNMPIMRLVRVWCTAVLLNKKHHDSRQIIQLMSKISILLRDSWSAGKFDADLWHFKWKIFCVEELGMLANDMSIWPPLSEVSAETWLKPINLPALIPCVKTARLPQVYEWRKFSKYTMSVPSVYRIPICVKEDPYVEPPTISQIIERYGPGIMDEFKELEDSPKTRNDHKYRLLGVHSTAPLKYIEIYARMGIKTAVESMHIAEGAGGVAMMTHLLLGTKKVYYNSLVDIKESVSHRFGVFIPPALIKYQSELTILGPEKCVETGGDITNPDMLEYFMKIAEYSRDLDLLTCDAETAGQFALEISLKITESVNKLAMLMIPGKPVIYKTFCHSITLLAIQCLILRQSLRNITVYVPYHSSNESYEVFITGYVSSSTSKTLQGGFTETTVWDLIPQLNSLKGRIDCPYPFLLTVPEFSLRTLKFLQYIGIESNLEQALQALTGGFLDDPEFPTLDSRRKIYRAMDQIRSGMVLKIEGLRQHTKVPQQIKKELIYKRTCLKVEFGIITEYHFNLQLLDYLLSGITLSEESWYNNYSVVYKGIPLFTLKLNYINWAKRYNKHWKKIIGHYFWKKNFKSFPVLVEPGLELDYLEDPFVKPINLVKLF